jgi:uncharacterized protein YjbI with pentapeptide repeats
MNLPDWPVIAAVCVLGMAALAAIWGVPKLQVRRWERAGVTGRELAELENSSRGTIVQVIGGVALILTFATTWAQIADTRRSTDKTLELTRLQQANERFTRALTQLASTHLEIRVGAITGLGDIVRTDASQREPVVQILLTYLHRRRPRPRLPLGGTELIFGPPVCAGPLIKVRSADPDTQAAVRVISERRNGTHPRYDMSSLGLRSVDARGGDFTGANLTNTSLAKANLNDALLNHTNLFIAEFTRACARGASFREAVALHATFAEANLEHADLYGADFESADLERADLAKANVRSVTFTNASLRGANLAGASFESAKLAGADLSGAKVTRRELRGAITDQCTRLPWHSHVPRSCTRGRG